MALNEGALVPVGPMDNLHDLVSMFSEMKITKRKNTISDYPSDSEDESENIYINGEKVVSYVTFHKYVPKILASLAKGKVITIMDNRLRESLSPDILQDSLLPVPYRSDPFSRLCDENTVISYDKANYIIKLWDLRNNYSGYKQPTSGNVIYLSSKATANNLNFYSQTSFTDDIDDASSSTNPKYSLAKVLTWPDSLPSVVVTYPDDVVTRKSSVVIEELPDDWDDPPRNRGEILPIIYKQSNLKRKHMETCDDISVCKRSISNCMKCDKPTAHAVFCDSCNLTDGKRKSTDDLYPVTKRTRTSDGYNRSDKTKASSLVDSKMKRKIEHDDLEHEFISKRRHLEAAGDLEKQPITITKSEPEPVAGTSSKCYVGNGPETLKGNSDKSKVVDVPKYMLDSVLLKSLFTTDRTNWQSKLRKQNCNPEPTKLPQVLA